MRADRAAVHLATLGPMGYLPGPGTWGSVAATLAAPFLFIPLPLWIKCLFLILLIAVGTRFASRAEAAFHCKDPKAVIIDEFAGQLLVFLLVRDPGPVTLLAGLGLFRLFDITKPWPVGASEGWFAGGTGIMVDDLFAGAYALLALHLLLAVT